MPVVLSAEVCEQLTASQGERIAVCPVCDMKVPDMRAHVGVHILRSLNGVGVDTKGKVCSYYVL